MNEDYQNDLKPASLPPWLQRADGTWQRTWTITFRAPPSALLLAALPDLSEQDFVVRIIAGENPSAFEVFTTVEADPLSDDHFVWAPRRTLGRLERMLGPMETINGYPREWFGTLSGDSG